MEDLYTRREKDKLAMIKLVDELFSRGPAKVLTPGMRGMLGSDLAIVTRDGQALVLNGGPRVGLNDGDVIPSENVMGLACEYCVGLFWNPNLLDPSGTNI